MQILEVCVERFYLTIAATERAINQSKENLVQVETAFQQLLDLQKEDNASIPQISFTEALFLQGELLLELAKLETTTEGFILAARRSVEYLQPVDPNKLMPLFRSKKAKVHSAASALLAKGLFQQATANAKSACEIQSEEIIQHVRGSFQLLKNAFEDSFASDKADFSLLDIWADTLKEVALVYAENPDIAQVIKRNQAILDVRIRDLKNVKIELSNLTINRWLQCISS